MKNKIKHTLKDNPVRFSVSLSLLLTVILIPLLIFTASQFPPYVPFFNSLPWGDERLYSSQIVYFIPIIMIAVFILNNSLSIVLYRKNTLVARILSFNSFLFIALCFLAYLQIIFLVF